MFVPYIVFVDVIQKNMFDILRRMTAQAGGLGWP